MTGTFDGLTQGTVLDGEMPVVDFTATAKDAGDGVLLYPINSEFGYIVTDFIGAVEKDFLLNPEYEEGWIGDLHGEGGEQEGIVVSNTETEAFKTPAVLGTWLAGLGGNTVKASTEHYVVMQHILSDQQFPDDPDALYPLDNNLKVIGGDYDGYAIKDLLDGVDVAGIGWVDIGDINGDGVEDVKDILEPNETTIDSNIAASTDYSVTLKDDGKLLYRWGNAIKKPNDIRLEAKIELPSEWSIKDSPDDLQKLYRITSAELLVNHTITNNPNDQLRPEGLENEAAIGTLPTYQILDDGSWVTTDDYYAGDGTLYPAGTVLKDPALAALWATSELAAIGAVDGAEGFTNAWYTTMDREPFEAAFDESGEYISGPRWRLQPDKYGQDLPSVVIPLDPSLPPPPTKDEVKYDVGEVTQTVINLLDWETPVSRMSISAGWQDQAGTTDINGLNLSPDFDLSVYIKGDIKPATLYNAELLLDYEEITIYAAGGTITGGAGDDYLVGQGDNTLIGGAGEDFFVLSYGTTISDANILSNIITDFTVGEDVLGLIGMGASTVELDTIMVDTNITQTVVGSDLLVSVGGYDLVTLQGVTEVLDATSFMTSTQYSMTPEVFVGTDGDDVLRGTSSPDVMYGLDGDDRILGYEGADTIYGGDGADTLNGGDGSDEIYGGDTAADLSDVVYAGDGNDTVDGGAGNDIIYGGLGDDVLIGGDGADQLYGQGGNDVLTGSSWGDLIFGGDGLDFINGGGGSDRLNGGAAADMFYHAGVASHGSDWIQDYDAAEGDVLVFGLSGASSSDFAVNFVSAGSGDGAVDEAFITYAPNSQILWALVDGADQTSINLQLDGMVYDLLA
ncbi:calcium-binding protein [Thalassovita taeanensis]|uniref:calcium-binding protein n=1 Tax=Thalassovita taeanensis TaxID=657014 RepID=UPI001587CE94|nr:calcium-binding protein [Thalassovita taeanensis]